MRGYTRTTRTRPSTAACNETGEAYPTDRRAREDAPAPQTANRATETEVTVAASNRMRDHPQDPPTADFCHGPEDPSFPPGKAQADLRYALSKWLPPARDGRASA